MYVCMYVCMYVMTIFPLNCTLLKKGEGYKTRVDVVKLGGLLKKGQDHGTYIVAGSKPPINNIIWRIWDSAGYVCMYVCMYVCKYLCFCFYVCVFVEKCVHTLPPISLGHLVIIFMYAYMHVCMYVYKCMYVNIQASRD